MSEAITETPLCVLYDDDCGLCRRLAEYGRTRSEGRLDFVAWQHYVTRDEAAQHFTDEERSAPPARLRTLQGEEVKEDHEAWAAILTVYPPFEKFSWIVERLGFMGVVSQATYHGATWLRGICGSCP